ncbi:hypothetical protein [Ramlibacter sp.]|uniref:Uncharacterized protein n=1 Tax=Ramlibacter aquaticus TaxID=2780094 RepID=A0ABR9SEG8_9BURK|nr:hypothetical protein [Ramlibacter sp.]MBE7940749.1 hypothetical protein [Ramlibacter aquaticus]
MPRRALKVAGQASVSTGLLAAALLCAGCGPSNTASAADEPGELQKLRLEVAHLREENAQLRLSPGLLGREVDEALRAGDAQRVHASLRTLSQNFPVSPETETMTQRVAAFDKARDAQAEAERRLAAQGLKALPVAGTLNAGDTTLALSSAALLHRWVFDSWGEGWRFEDAEKQHRLLVARVTVSSRQREPALFGLAAYVADGARLRRVGELRYRFSRWSDYGAFLGTHADFRNDFAHSWRVPLTAAVSLPEQDLQRKPLFLVATAEGCHQRGYERFGQPPVFYTPKPCASLKEVLEPGDFLSGKLVLLRRLD